MRGVASDLETDIVIAHSHDQALLAELPPFVVGGSLPELHVVPHARQFPGPQRVPRGPGRDGGGRRQHDKDDERGAEPPSGSHALRDPRARLLVYPPFNSLASIQSTPAIHATALRLSRRKHHARTGEWNRNSTVLRPAGILTAL